MNNSEKAKKFPPGCMCECKINILFTRGFILAGAILVGNKYIRYTWNAFIHRQTKVLFNKNVSYCFRNSVEFIRFDCNLGKKYEVKKDQNSSNVRIALVSCDNEFIWLIERIIRMFCRTIRSSTAG